MREQSGNEAEDNDSDSGEQSGFLVTNKQSEIMRNIEWERLCELEYNQACEEHLAAHDCETTNCHICNCRLN